MLAVLTVALFLAEHTADADDVLGRLTGRTFWDIVDTLVTGVAFGLIGLELHTVFGTADGHALEMVGWGLAVVAVVVGVRLLWLLPATWLAKRLHTRRDVSEEIPTSWRETVVMWWAGMRGVASVALALAIPLETDDGQPFPGREEIIFIAFAVIMATLVFQGLTLPWLVRKLNVRADTAARRPWSATSRSGPPRPPSTGSRRSRRSRSSPRRWWSGSSAPRTTSAPGSAPTWSTRSGARRSPSGRSASRRSAASSAR